MSTRPFGEVPEPRGSAGASPGKLSLSRPGRDGVSRIQLWRSLDELKTGRHGKPTAPAVPKPFDTVTRGQFLKLMGASMALAGVTACQGPNGGGKLAPYVKRPEEVIPGYSLYYATAYRMNGYAYGIIVRQYAGRPVKVEGNPQHPASLGATDMFGQSTTLTLYDPERSARVLDQNNAGNWPEFAQTLTTQVGFHRTTNGGAGLAFLTPTVTSPTMANLMNAIQKQMPNAAWHQWQPINRDNVRAATMATFGTPLNPIYHFDAAKVILSLDSDFLEFVSGHLRYAHDYATQKVVGPSKMTQNRMYVAESTPTITGAKADHRVPVKPFEIEGIARAVAAGLGVAGASGAAPAGVPADWISAAVADLKANGGASIVIAGDYQPPAVHQLAYLMNEALGNVGKTVDYTDPIEFNWVDQTASLKALVDNMNAGKVDLLLILDGNPAYDAPPDFNFPAALAKVNSSGMSVHLSLYEDETSALTTWHVPMTHDLEAWGDARAFDGTATVMQPLIAPLYQGHSPLELLAIVNGQGEANTHGLVKGYWQAQLGNPADFQTRWDQLLNDGYVPNTALPGKGSKPTATAAPAPSPAPPSGIEVNFRPDPTIFDGRFAPNAWLQETPKAMTRMTWDNVVYVSPAMAQQQGLATGDRIVIRYAGGSLNAPIWVQPGQPDGAITLHLGYGRPKAGPIGTDIGYNAYPLRTSGALWFGGGASIAKTGQTYTLATTQHFQTMEGLDLVKAGTLADFQKNPAHLITDQTPPGTLYPGFDYNGNRWGMSINLSTCIGCNACVVACQAENNIPVVGKEQVNIGRQMQWLRIDQYYEGDPANPTHYFQPVPCMQCEVAPCELVCPVDATVHSADGLNDMVYNRCIGTRYCSNNCPYKVRRFNFLLYSDWNDDLHRLVYNPDVTVRERGVMEKCTYCVQRIRLAEQHALAEGTDMPPAGAVETACQAACPTSAIIFGNMNNPKDPIIALKESPLNYSLLGELNTRPRTTYLGFIGNPNPAIKGV